MDTDAPPGQEDQDDRIAGLEARFAQLNAAGRTAHSESAAGRAFASARRTDGTFAAKLQQLRQATEEMAHSIDTENVGVGEGPFLTRLAKALELLDRLSTAQLSEPGGAATDPENVQKGSLLVVAGVLGSWMLP